MLWAQWTFLFVLVADGILNLEAARRVSRRRRFGWRGIAAMYVIFAAVFWIAVVAGAFDKIFGWPS